MSLIALNDVVVGERIRKDLGDLTGLRDSIKGIGLLNPITLSSDNTLLAGARRLEACRQLGWEKVPFTQPLSREDAVAALTAERDENTCRKAMTQSELVMLGRKLEALEAPKAKERQREAGGDRRSDSYRSGSTEPKRSESASTDRVVGEALGISASTYKRLKQVEKATSHPDPVVAETAVSQLAQLDQGSTSPSAAARTVGAAIARRAEGSDIPPPIPIGRKTGPQRIKARAEARHSLVAVAIALQTAARQMNAVIAVDLEFTSSDTELDQAPGIIADSVKAITESLKEISYERNRTATA